MQQTLEDIQVQANQAKIHKQYATMFKETIGKGELVVTIKIGDKRETL